MTSVPPTTQGHGNYIATLGQQIRYIICLVLQTPVVDGPAWCQIKITDTFSIDITFIHSMRCNVGGCGSNFFSCIEFFSEQRCRSVKRILRESLFYPLCLPIRGVQQGHLPKSRLAPH